jgi:hypothetical protein
MTRAKKHYDAVKSDPEKYAAYLARKRAEDAARRKSRPGYDAKRRKQWRERNKERSKLMRRVNFAVYRAVRDGKLVRPNACSKCGRVAEASPERTEK